MLTSILAISLILTHTTPINEELRAKPFVLTSLEATVSIELDRVEIPTISARSLDDAACAQGWLHARERFLPMDLARREAAGELAELLPAGIDMDRAVRPLQLRAVATRALAAIPARHRVLLERYAAGVNAQLELTIPFEYKLLRLTPKRWSAEDSLLVQLGMARYLDGSATVDRTRAKLFDGLARDLAVFFTSTSGPLDMSVDGSKLPEPPQLPTAAQLDLRHIENPRADAAYRRDFDSRADTSRETVPGSNAFAIAGTRTKDGRAIVGNDMHLMLMAPGIWYRVRMCWPGAELTGLSLPGIPLVVQGTNGHVAWAFTNLTADLADLIVVEPDPSDATRYLTADGSEAFTTETVLLGSGDRQEPLRLRTTRFGPVVDTVDGRPVALRWASLLPGGLDCGLFDLVNATTLESALETARAWNGPPQNTLIASSDGRIGWTIAGALPNRATRTPAPVSWRDAPEWDGIVPPARKPMIVDPSSGVLTSGNQLCMAPGGLAGVIGADEAAGDRARRLRELLTTRSDWSEPELHTIQLDTHSARLVRWRDALIAVLDETRDAAESNLDADDIRDALESLRAWNGRTDIAEAAPVLLDFVRRAVRTEYARALAGLPEMRESDIGREAIEAALEDEALLRVIESKPDHLLPGPFNSWHIFLANALADAATRARDANGAFRTRGEDNRAWIRHPAADALGPAARLAEMPKAPLPGHPTSVRVQTPRFGASQRSVVSPAHLDDAILVTPCGQSGMPTSPHFRSLHQYWQDGTSYPLLPGEATARIELLREPPAIPATPATPAMNSAPPEAKAREREGV